MIPLTNKYIRVLEDLYAEHSRLAVASTLARPLLILGFLSTSGPTPSLYTNGVNTSPSLLRSPTIPSRLNWPSLLSGCPSLLSESQSFCCGHLSTSFDFKKTCPAILRFRFLMALIDFKAPVGSNGSVDAALISGAQDLSRQRKSEQFSCISAAIWF